MDFCSILKLARVSVGNISKKGENMEGIITCSIFAIWVFNRTLSIYIKYTCLEYRRYLKTAK